MDRISLRRRRVLSLVASAFVGFVVAVVAFDLAAVPSPRGHHATAPSPGGGSLPSTFPPGAHRLVSNNLKTGDTLELDLLTLPQTAIWVLASSNTGPSYLGPYFTDLGPDWFVLQGPLLMGGGSHLQLGVPVPTGAGLTGLEFTVQCAAVSPLASDVGFSNSVALRVSQGPAKNVLLLRQTGPGCGNGAAAQADSLAIGLQLLGIHVTTVDDVLPLSLLDYDCIFDLRFSTPPAPDEAARYVQFLKSCGGLFFVAGPWTGCQGGQMRAGWVHWFLNTILGVSLTVSSGGALSNASVETIDPAAGPEFLAAASGIAGLPLDVSDEGGNFGPPGAVNLGIPWLTGTTVFGPTVYGMFFEPAVMSSQTVGGRVAVLFAGGSSTFVATATSPYPDLVMANMAYYLDR
jgi:hypothetical protein